MAGDVTEVRDGDSSTRKVAQLEFVLWKEK